MAKIGDLKLTSLWNAAIPLSRAALHFAPMDIRTKWAELPKLSDMAERSKSVEQVAIGSSWMDLIGGLLVGVNSILAPRTKLMDSAQSLLLSHIQAGRIIGLGFEPPRQIKSVPVHIPAQYWNQFVSWENSEISSGALSFSKCAC